LLFLFFHVESSVGRESRNKGREFTLYFSIVMSICWMYLCRRRRLKGKVRVWEAFALFYPVLCYAMLCVHFSLFLIHNPSTL
jgi:hypothetical protein